MESRFRIEERRYLRNLGSSSHPSKAETQSETWEKEKLMTMEEAASASAYVSLFSSLVSELGGLAKSHGKKSTWNI